jgi:hypothetical protein
LAIGSCANRGTSNDGSSFQYSNQKTTKDPSESMSMRTQDQSDEKPVVISATRARQGVVSGRVITVLVSSLCLALIAMVLLMAYFYGFWPFAGLPASSGYPVK